MARFELDPKAIDYDALPPLVPQYADEAQARALIDGLVDAWATQLVQEPEYGECPGVTLVDGRTGEPIDLGVLLRRVAERVAHLAQDGGAAPGVAVALRGCRVVLSRICRRRSALRRGCHRP